MTLVGRASGRSRATELECSRTGQRRRLDRPAGLSDSGAPWLVRYDLDAGAGRRLRAELPARPWGVWRYPELLPVQDLEARLDLGEGGSPLVRARCGGLRVWLKNEAGNPTGSFKDRGLSVAVSRARELGAPGVQLASAGNAALSLAAYAAAGGLPCRVALPADSPGAVERGCRACGAEVLQAPGTLVEARELLAQRDDGYWDLSTFREPYRVEGKKTMGLEIAEQLGWRLPEWIVYPTGGGTGIIGMEKAFDELQQLGLIDASRPRFVVVQMAGCAPIVRAFERGLETAPPWESPRTRVWGLRVPRALADFLILSALRRSRGLAVTVEEEAVAERRGRAARELGLAIGPEGAAALEAAARLASNGTFAEGERVVVFQTGHPANYGE